MFPNKCDSIPGTRTRDLMVKGYIVIKLSSILSVPLLVQPRDFALILRRTVFFNCKLTPQNLKRGSDIVSSKSTFSSFSHWLICYQKVLVELEQSWWLCNNTKITYLFHGNLLISQFRFVSLSSTSLGR